MRVLITGASGFVGGYLAQALLHKFPDSVVVVGTASSVQSVDKLPELRDRVDWRVGDLLNEQFVTSLIDASFDWIFHLAAFASAGKSFSHPASVLENNIKAELLLLERLKSVKSSARILIVGSIDVYGMVDEAVDVVEDTPFNPVSPYAVSKIAQDYLGLQYFLSHGLDVVRVRPSNHIGAQQAEQYVVPSFCHQVALIEAGKQEPVLYVGNTHTIRDFTDVRDMVEAYILALEQGKGGDVYVLGSGRGTSIEDLLNTIIKQSTVTISIKRDESRVRPNDIKRLVVNADKFKQLTNWQPNISLDESLHAILDYWRNQIKEN